MAALPVAPQGASQAPHGAARHGHPHPLAWSPTPASPHTHPDLPKAATASSSPGRPTVTQNYLHSYPMATLVPTGPPWPAHDGHPRWPPCLLPLEDRLSPRTTSTASPWPLWSPRAHLGQPKMVAQDNYHVFFPWKTDRHPELPPQLPYGHPGAHGSSLANPRWSPKMATMSSSLGRLIVTQSYLHSYPMATLVPMGLPWPTQGGHHVFFPWETDLDPELPPQLPYGHPGAHGPSLANPRWSPRMVTMSSSLISPILTQSPAPPCEDPVGNHMVDINTLIYMAIANFLQGYFIQHARNALKRPKMSPEQPQHCPKQD
ncbi:uncharacterized protein LOC119148923 [Falco rusticolus]|uniref:uncharacterized protein LOC119148923 n=1 Tax=Falco rusticolus TaxID=120794 RepID=UPI0018867185|nr:uncharacterized protein LOC119148923 [Falco rusticolus]